VVNDTRPMRKKSLPVEQKGPINCDRRIKFKGTITKANIIHPNQASLSVAGIALKRMAPCTRTVNGAEECEHVFKTGLCIDCSSVENPWSKSKWARYYTYPKDMAWWGYAGGGWAVGRHTLDANGTLAKPYGMYFRNTAQGMVKPNELKNFARTCIPHAFRQDPEQFWRSDFVPEQPLKLQEPFQCKSTDMARFKDWLKSF